MIFFTWLFSSLLSLLTFGFVTGGGHGHDEHVKIIVPEFHHTHHHHETIYKTIHHGGGGGGGHSHGGKPFSFGGHGGWK
ncbi:hypothetical protein ABEB36_001658 [Hypothenemus hampei]|uniref:Uncharacterized protein n=1 Tax=Hypothenemus hampei TaxID=57062 RepID=A0ABD1FFA4_HYPHA